MEAQCTKVLGIPSMKIIRRKDIKELFSYVLSNAVHLGKETDKLTETEFFLLSSHSNTFFFSFAYFASGTMADASRMTVNGTDMSLILSRKDRYHRFAWNMISSMA